MRQNASGIAFISTGAAVANAVLTERFHDTYQPPCPGYARQSRKRQLQRHPSNRQSSEHAESGITIGAPDTVQDTSE